MHIEIRLFLAKILEKASWLVFFCGFCLAATDLDPMQPFAVLIGYCLAAFGAMISGLWLVNFYGKMLRRYQDKVTRTKYLSEFYYRSYWNQVLAGRNN